MKNVCFSDLFELLTRINRLAKEVDDRFVIILDFSRFEFWSICRDEYIFRTSDVELFYQKMHHFYYNDLFDAVYNCTGKIPSVK